MGQAILTFNNYQSTQIFDKNSKRIKSSNNFSKYEINPFFEYGLSDNLTIGANPTLQYWQAGDLADNSKTVTFRGCGTTKAIDGNKANGEIIESEFFIRKKLLEIGNMVFSMQPLVKTPCVLIVNSGAAVNWNSYETELRGLIGYGFKWNQKSQDGKTYPFAGQYHFLNLEVAYRKYNGALSDQVRIDATSGFRFNENILLLAQVFSSISTGKENISADITTNDTQENIDRFGNVKLQLSGVLQTSKTTSAQLGVYTEIAGLNYSAGQGMMISLWKVF